MRQISSLLFLSILLISLNANALLITDTYVVEQQVSYQSGAGHTFELIPAGYSPETDSITHIKLIYDFTEIISETNLGDPDEYDENYPGGQPPYENEFVIFSSWLFGWRDVYADIDTGLTVFETDWTRSNHCQYELTSDPAEDDAAYCLLNIDLAGTMNAYVNSYTYNLWLHSITLEIEVDRAEVSEPNSILLLGVGLFAVGFLRHRKLRT